MYPGYSVFDFTPPENPTLQGAFAAAMRLRMMRTEMDVLSFLCRTGLKVEDVTLVQLPSGNQYPQWKGAVRKEPGLVGGDD